jgi:hypothetical protein
VIDNQKKRKQEATNDFDQTYMEFRSALRQPKAAFFSLLVAPLRCCDAWPEDKESNYRTKLGKMILR